MNEWATFFPPPHSEAVLSKYEHLIDLRNINIHTYSSDKEIRNINDAKCIESCVEAALCRFHYRFISWTCFDMNTSKFKVILSNHLPPGDETSVSWCQRCVGWQCYHQITSLWTQDHNAYIYIYTHTAASLIRSQPKSICSQWKLFVTAINCTEKKG